MQIKCETSPEVCASLGLVTCVTVINEHVAKPKVKPDEELLTLTCKWKIERMEPEGDRQNRLPGAQLCSWGEASAFQALAAPWAGDLHVLMLAEAVQDEGGPSQ